jgi:hypothetical protein
VWDVHVAQTVKTDGRRLAFISALVDVVSDAGGDTEAMM